ncbi:MAG: polysaccharide biosynthesis protein [Clostridiales bacterium]|nr:polysaccharide biosynthesis protein [Clostridiales bacterium]
MSERSVKFLHRLCLIIADVFAVTIAAAFAYFCTVAGAKLTTAIWLWWAVNVAAGVLILLAYNLYNVVFSTVGLPELAKGVIASATLGIGNVAFALITKDAHITIATACVYTLTLFCLTSAIRLQKRFLRYCKRVFAEKGTRKVRVMIVGGGAAGVALIKEMQDSEKSTYKPVCIADDDFEKRGKAVRGVKIGGNTYEVKRLVTEYGVQEIFVTMPSADKKALSEIVKRCQECNCPVKILPGIYQMANGEVTIAKLRQVDVQDLLGREQVRVNLDEIMGYIENKVVLVTGGGGSIGSELCRQIATHKPQTLIILDIYENNAYEIEQELKRANPALHLLTLIASVRDRDKMRDVFDKYRPQIVFHAAAHKHVPLMETSPNEAVKNNVFGTLNVAQCADEFGVETFVQISTDKAVNPTNIMGATKRICEMIIQTIGRHSKNTNFVAVRFGNVLGSNGSVIPLFKKQIAEGGPLTVTHKDIIRYFMTIPEAVSLVLQAGAYAKGGQIFVLDMGEPVRIYDLAYNLIKLSGFEPNVDIDIVCTGLRPGEKLYEERLMEEEGLQKTENGLISIAKPIELDEKKLWDMLDKLRDEAYGELENVKGTVKELVPTYTIDKRNSVAEALHIVEQIKDETQVG